ncbi:hypothetical protein DYB25_000066 [Aphanomyces astaci]|uniref:WH2 domain-containing protein n=1 Tax=Aphanomyces astaci TaxID=112090 RepID=A0A397F1V7_APHAT|nr:hypothetical protein DYB36_000014 [Aphanomyces astaci]RHY19124.1 hypothetical protein DYB25_000066 [Aphanomyces astaci]RHY43549.1 hypothetical protein DYB30_000264 [Aphanomyces astaci]RHY53234.1 hypothetical protein DYB38_000147 [Aphanomyces astaci]RHY55781.1 hypothetical protein DYB34_001786 [Aphanomyces astaci]
MSSALPVGWMAYKTADGKVDLPDARIPLSLLSFRTKTASSEPVSTPPASGGGGDRGGLLAQIAQGKKLKKTITRESSPLDAVKPSTSTSSSDPSSSSSGGGNPLFAAIAQGAAGLKKSTHRTPSMRASEQPSPTDASSSSGGFADIMRKNREAAAKRAGNTETSITTTSSNAGGSTSPVLQPSSFRQSLPVAATSSGEFADQLNRIEAKLDKLLAHLNVN